MSYLEKVKEFRRATGLDAGQSVELHDALIREELSELADALADSIVVLCGKFDDGYLSGSDFYGMMRNLKESAEWACVDIDRAFDIVHKSNMSKLCTSDEIEPTCRKYSDLGVAVEFRETSDNLFGCYSLGGHADYPAGKLLKSVGYHAPDWSGDEWIL